MNTNTIHHCRIASSAAATLIATGTVLAAQLGAAAPATAKYDNYYVAIAVGDLNDAPPVQTVAGLMIGPDEGQTDQKALSNCVGGGGRQCVVEISVENTCAAVASNDFGEFGTASDPTLQVAKNNAETKLANKQGVHVVEAYCSEGPDQLPPPDQPAPAPTGAKLGPTASFNQIVGGLEAHITDRSGVASQCTYAMANVNRSFALAANASYDLKIVPATLRFKDASVIIKCDNGTSTQTTAKF